MEESGELTVWLQRFCFCIVPYILFQKTLKWFIINKHKGIHNNRQTFKTDASLFLVPEPMISWNSISESWRWKCDGKPARRRRTSAFSAKESTCPAGELRGGAERGQDTTLNCTSPTRGESRCSSWEPADPWCCSLSSREAANPSSRHTLAELPQPWASLRGCKPDLWRRAAHPWAPTVLVSGGGCEQFFREYSTEEWFPFICAASAHDCCRGCCSRSDQLFRDTCNQNFAAQFS